ncbi:MAG: esterase-like activity of phytase family protein [Amaricoccus sp.]
MRSTPIFLALLAGLATAARAEETLPATLAGFAALPALTLALPPADAPRDALVSGKFAAGPTRVDAPMSVIGDTGPAQGSRPTGIAFPFIGQPVQGFSGLAMTPAADGSVYVLTDNGFGTKANSSDALLVFHRVALDWATGKVALKQAIYLRDPDRILPFRIVNDGSEARYLTGADLDPESIQVIGDSVWIGEELGPWLVRATLDGRVTGIFATAIDGKPVKSPDNPALSIPAAPVKDWQSARSGGFEGMGLNPETGMLWALLEKPLVGEDGKPAGNLLPLLEFDPRTGGWTGKRLSFPLGEGAASIGDLNFIDGHRALVIERDNGEGDAAQACPEGKPAPDCYPVPAKVKRIVLIDIAKADAEGRVARLASIDLLAIADPDGKGAAAMGGHEGGAEGKSFSFPFVTIENVMKVDDSHILVINDNNLPFSTGRSPDRAADNEVLLLSVPELLSTGIGG